ncbi:MAG: hypothetical protein COV48_12855, partial [Elusimicrobia bacterium CG11_big_fil_rev_8_21_14_0_20_64_6]
MRNLLAAALLIFMAAGPAEAVRPSARAKEEARRFGLNKLQRPPRRQPRAGTQKEFSRFNSTHEGRWKLRINPDTGLPEALSGGRTAPRSGHPEAVARQFLREQQPLLGIDPTELKLEKESRGNGHRHVLY